jgi:protein-L-isoaspartate(D-aspartate) O-methyltransferase
MEHWLVNELSESGHLTADWRPSFRAVPRYQFIPETIWRPETGRCGPDLVPLRRKDHPDQWLELAAGDDLVITQVDDGQPVGPDGVGEIVTSSASMPRVVALMLQHLEVSGGEQVLEIGTGTGWNAALLAHRLGAERVTSIEVDPQIAANARTALSDAGFGEVTVVTGDGALGYPARVPYDRVIATVACTQMPYAWVEQTRPGGRIVAPSWALEYHGLLLALTVAEGGTATGQAVDHVSFMRLRDHRTDPRSAAFRSTEEEERRASVTETCVHPAEVASGDYALGAVIAIGTRVAECEMDYFPSRDPDSRNGTLRLIDYQSRSWARLYYDHDGGPPHQVHQYGPRKLWDEVEAAYTWWVEHDRPSANCWQFSVTPKGQQITLISPRSKP